ncbi:MAG: response regulator transcription factor [Bdellovibrionaceae bacterium]|nr:response regulator transcription factor [Pseudobdellovibrionaceae bacterium]NUM59936.1 response regulator transcription factor [Pseudobdellovibrionaceae bacterium]
MKKILLIEDDKNLADSLEKYLSKEGFQIKIWSHLSEGFTILTLFSPDLIVLDWMLPDGQGVDFIRELRSIGVITPLILLTSRADLVDKVLGLESGANDYMTKPFEPRELVARIRTQLRTQNSFQKLTAVKESYLLQEAEITMNTQTLEVLFQSQKKELTKIEFHLLKLFMENPNKVFPREALLNEVWGYESYPTTRTVDNHILQLRQKFHPDFFETVRGIGYRFKVSK